MTLELERWVEEQRQVASALGLTAAEWGEALERAGRRRTELMAAVIGAATARGLGLGIVREIDGERLGARARALLDPGPPKVVRHPVVAAAIRQGDVQAGQGAQRLRSARPVAAPRRGSGSLGPSDGQITPDAPGESTE